MRKTIPLLTFALAAAFLTAFPATAASESSYAFDGGSGPLVEFTLKGSNGYSTTVEAFGRTVRLTVLRGLSNTEYTTRGKVSATGIRARFGSRGLVSVRFRPSGKVQRNKPPKGCHGQLSASRSGVFVGTIKFAGEHHYTKIDASRSRGTTTSPRWKCKRSPGFNQLLSTLHDSNMKHTVLIASTPSNSRRFDVVGPPASARSAPSIFTAGITERRRSLRIVRSANTFADTPAFSFDNALSFPTVSPPPPFHGSATLQRNPDGSTSWKGSLSVSFPGGRSIALTGPRFSARLYQP